MLTGTTARAESPWCGAFQLNRPPVVPTYTMDALTSVPKEKIDAFRREFLDELPDLAREYIDTARAESTTAGYEKVMNTALKVIEGLQVQERKDIYANLPVIHVTFGPSMEMATQIAPAPVPDADQVVDVEVKSPFGSSASKDFGTLPPDLLDLLPAPVPTAAEQETLDALALAGSAMALD